MQLWGFWRANGPGYMGQAFITWVPMGAGVAILAPNDHPNPSQGRQKGFENVQVPLNGLNNGNCGHSSIKVLWQYVQRPGRWAESSRVLEKEGFSKIFT